MGREPNISVGIMDRQTEIGGRMNGAFAHRAMSLFRAGFGRVRQGVIVLTDGAGKELARSASISAGGGEGGHLRPFRRSHRQAVPLGETRGPGLPGNLLLKLREDNTLAVINEISAEEYLRSVVSSEMSAAAPMEFLKAHAILSRSWLLSALERRGRPGKSPSPSGSGPGDGRGDQAVRAGGA